MKTITPSEVMKCCDIERRDVSTELLSFMGQQEPAYRDKSETLREHLYSIESVIEDIDENSLSTSLLEELLMLLEVVRKHEAGYVRFVNN